MIPAGAGQGRSLRSATAPEHPGRAGFQPGEARLRHALAPLAAGSGARGRSPYYLYCVAPARLRSFASAAPERSGCPITDVDVTEFVLAELPHPPARVLEVGCGSGELALELAGAGYDVLAIDPEAPRGALFRQTTLEELEEPGPFEAVFASRSLHHVEDLGVALDKIVGLLRPRGAIILDEFAWDRLDGQAAAEVGIDFDEWRDEHEGLHTASAMLDELGKRFEERSFSWEPYLHREARQAVSEERERELIDAGRLAATGFRYVGMR
jgi:2-polyprenyl-3-methyl-5-hydroxy-6-metoxy-1,4-benzoquinol methylase